MRLSILSASCCAVILSGCAGLEFSDGPRPDGLPFRDPVPHLLVKVAPDCAVTSEVVALPGKQRSVRLRSGLGSADLAVHLDKGIITSVNQKTDTKIPETIGAVAGLAKTVADVATAEGFVAGGAEPPKRCASKVTLHRIGEDGAISTTPSFTSPPAN